MTNESHGRLLDPIERISEILFGLIMALTITNSVGIAQQGGGDGRALLWSALGCNLAWGAIDAAMYVMALFNERGRSARLLRKLCAADPAPAQEAIAAAMPPVLAAALQPEDFDVIRQRLSELPLPKTTPLIATEDWLAAVGVFLLVFLSTFPVVIPFNLIGEARLALRLSNGVAVLMLFLCGYSLGRYSGGHPWRMGLAMVAIGIVLVGVAIALGG
jgi:hypothetical protein